MASVNKVILVGHLGRDPEVRFTNSGMAVANVSLATSRAWKDKQSGERQEETEWHRLVFMDRLAEVAQQYLKRGALCYVEGRLKTNKWTDKEGTERYTTEIVCDRLQMLGGRDDDGDDDRAPAPAAPRSRQAAPSPAPNAYAAASGRSPNAAPRPSPAPRPATGFDDMDDDIPF